MAKRPRKKAAYNPNIPPRPTIAYCYASGVIEFGPYPPRGTLPIAAGPREKLEELISGACRHAYDGKTLLVPGIPEAATQSDGLDALKRFRDFNRAHWVAEGLEV